MLWVRISNFSATGVTGLVHVGCAGNVHLRGVVPAGGDHNYKTGMGRQSQEIFGGEVYAIRLLDNGGLIR